MLFIFSFIFCYIFLSYIFGCKIFFLPNDYLTSKPFLKILLKIFFKTRKALKMSFVNNNNNFNIKYAYINICITNINVKYVYINNA